MSKTLDRNLVYLLWRPVTLIGSHSARYFARLIVARRVNYRSLPEPHVVIGHLDPCYAHLLFGSFHNDNSYIQPYLDRTKTFILSSFLMSLDSIIFVHKCPIQCDLVRVTEVFSCMRDWLKNLLSDLSQ